ncbi:MAG: DnaA/Hda family protein [Planctomycetota bacterium]
MARSADTREQLWQDAGNRQAVLAARHFVEQPGELNPLCIFGPASSGKSHLLAWIDGNLFRSGRKVTRLDPGKMFAMVGLSRRDRRRSPLLELAETAQAAIIDLAHQLAGKRETQRELAHVLKRWLERGIPVVIASRLHPKSIQGLDPVVAAILVSGFLVQLPSMSSELRARILQQRLLKGGRQVAHERLQWLAENVAGSLDEQLAVAEQWLGQGGEPDLAGLTIAPRTPDHVITWISKRFGVSTQQIYSCSKARSTRLPRRLAMYWLSDRMRLDLDELAQLFGFRNRRSVRDHVSWIKNAIPSDPDIARWVLDMERELDGPGQREQEFGT